MGCQVSRGSLDARPRCRDRYVFAHMRTGSFMVRTRCEENSVSIEEFDRRPVGIVENSWAKLGGMEDRVEVCGTGGVIYADLVHGELRAHLQRKRLRICNQKAGATQGWTFTTFEEAFNQGYPQELLHFINCVRD